MVESFDLNALFSAINDQRLARGLTWSGVAKEIEERFVKMSPSTIKGIGDRPRVEGDGVLQILLWLGRVPESFISGYRGPLVPLRPARPGTILRWDTATIFRAVDQKRKGSNLTWKEVADEIGEISPQQLKGLSNGGRTFLPEVMRVAAWIEVPASELTKESAT